MKDDTKKIEKECPDCGWPNNGHKSSAPKEIIKIESKNGYEIRLDILKTSVNLADSYWRAQLDKNIEEWHECSNKPAMPMSIPTDNRIAEAIKNAKELYKFVEQGR